MWSAALDEYVLPGITGRWYSFVVLITTTSTIATKDIFDLPEATNLTKSFYKGMDQSLFTTKITSQEKSPVKYGLTTLFFSNVFSKSLLRLIEA